jgi:hypothetical protein
MKLQDAYNRITFKVGTMDDASGRALNPIVTNRVLIAELIDQLRSYANITKGIQDIYSFSANRNVVFVNAPELALRSQGYFHAHIISNAMIFPMDFRGQRDVYNNFKVNPVYGITNWLMPWNAGHSQFIGAYPSTSISAKTTTLTAGVSISDTTIPVAASAGYIANWGRITIDSEKILYEYKDATNFYQCIRGVEQTVPAIHANTATVTENNVILGYSRLPVPITLTNDNIITSDQLGMELDPCDEHMEGIIKSTVYNLLIKIDPQRAIAYKVDSQELYEQYKSDIEKGYARNRQNVNVRMPDPSSESGIPYGTNLMY